MESGLYVALSGQVALQKRLETIANNVANAPTIGYRAEDVDFESIMSVQQREKIAFAAPSGQQFNRSSGAVKATGNALDVAVQGRAFLAIDTPAGQVYTRDGRMQLTEQGDLLTVTGHAVMDVGGAPVRLDPAGGPISILPNGSIQQGGQTRGQIGLFELPATAKLSRYGTSGFTSDVAAQPVVDYTANNMLQGHLEGSNVNPVLEMTRLIGVTRAFDTLTAAMNTSDATFSDSIKTLAGNN